MENFSEKVSFIWGVADLLRGDYKQSEYGRVILPFILLRRLDQVLSLTREAVREVDKASRRLPAALRQKKLLKASGVGFYNTSPLDFPKLLADPDQIAGNLAQYLAGFSENVRDIMERFRFALQVERLDGANLLFLVVQKFNKVDLHPYRRNPDGAPKTGDDGKPLPNVTNHEMGYIFEELIRKFSEQSNETAGEHFTPREVIHLMVHLLFAEDEALLTAPGIVRTMYDPACGTGGMLSVSEEQLSQLNPQALLDAYGQELNDESYAICKADRLVKGQQADNIKCGNSFSDDGLADLKADYLISNPPFGVDWSKAEKEVKREHDTQGHAGRFGPGLPRKNDGSLLFLLHMLSKMKPAQSPSPPGGRRKSPSPPGERGWGEGEVLDSIDSLEFTTSPFDPFATPSPGQRGWGEGEGRALHEARATYSDTAAAGGSRLAIVFNGSPLFTGAADSGESNIRQWIIENDWLEAIVALPDQMFYNTGIATYIWLVTNRKAPERRGKVQLINGVRHFRKMRKSLGDKRKELGPEDIDTLTRLYHGFQQGPEVKIFDNADFGFRRITVERPLQLAFHPRDDLRLEALQAEKPWCKLADERRAAILAALGVLEERYLARTPFFQAINLRLVKGGGANLSAAEKKLLQKHLGSHDPQAEVCKVKGQPEPDPDLRDYENVPLKEDVAEYMAREVLPHLPDAWVDEGKTKIGYEIPFTRHFYEYKPPRPPAEIKAEIEQLEAEIQGLLKEALG